MARQGKLLALLALCGLLQACGTLRHGGAPDPSFDINADLALLAKEFESATNISKYYEMPLAQRKDARNRFISGRLVQIDLRYLQFIRALTSDKQQLDAATDVANLTLNLAGTLVGGARSKTNLAAAAAGIGGTKTIIDKDFYYEKSIDALVATMNARRKEVLLPILNGLTQTIDEFPFEFALSQLHQYYLAGTLNGAIQFIHTEAGIQDRKNDQELLKVRGKLIPLSAEKVNAKVQMTQAIGSAGLTDETLKKAHAALKALGVKESDLPKTPEAAKNALQEKVASAIDEKTIDQVGKAFKDAGLLKTGD